MGGLRTMVVFGAARPESLPIPHRLLVRKLPLTFAPVISVSLPYPDRFCIRQPGDAGFGLGAHLD